MASVNNVKKAIVVGLTANRLMAEENLSAEKAAEKAAAGIKVRKNSKVTGALPLFAREIRKVLEHQNGTDGLSIPEVQKSFQNRYAEILRDNPEPVAATVDRQAILQSQLDDLKKYL